MSKRTDGPQSSRAELHNVRQQKALRPSCHHSDYAHVIAQGFGDHAAQGEKQNVSEQTGVATLTDNGSLITFLNLSRTFKYLLIHGVCVYVF